MATKLTNAEMELYKKFLEKDPDFANEYLTPNRARHKTSSNSNLKSTVNSIRYRKVFT